MDTFVVVVLLVIFFVVSILGYVALMIFFPESVGITGKIAKKNLKTHEEEKQPHTRPSDGE